MSPSFETRRFENSYVADELGRGRVVVKRCMQCAHAQFPALPRCPSCGSWEFGDEVIGEGGQVYSWIRINRSELVPDDAVSLLPLAIVTVDMDAGVRLFGRYADARTPEVGERVQGVFTEDRGKAELVFKQVAP